ncbi:MAG: hypothetical protein JNK61_02975 [Bacteroidia bacterium]|nr:hypothetical protein [Bacteroidia bacterium]
MYHKLLFLLLISLIACNKKTIHGPVNFKDKIGDKTYDCIYTGMQGLYTKHSCNCYDAQNTLVEAGHFLQDTIAIGWHTYFRADGTMQAQREFINLTDTTIYMNRVIRFNKNGVDTNLSQSNFFTIGLDTSAIPLNENLNAVFYLTAPVFENSYIQVSLVNDDGSDMMLPGNKTRMQTFTAKVNKRGAFNLRGFIDEIKPLDLNADTTKAQKRRLYFTIPYSVY